MTDEALMTAVRDGDLAKLGCLTDVTLTTRNNARCRQLLPVGQPLSIGFDESAVICSSAQWW